MEERTLVYFADSPLHVLEAYVENGEGFDRAGGFAVQVRFDPTLPSCLHRCTSTVHCPRSIACLCSG